MKGSPGYLFTPGSMKKGRLVSAASSAMAPWRRYLLYFIIMLVCGCSERSGDVVEIRHYPMDALDGVISTSDVRVDKDITSDQKGSLRITASKPRTVLLYETGDIDVENARLIYQSKLRTEGVKGQVYLEMWCHFSGRGEFFSRALQSPLFGNNEWTSQETSFFLEKGQNPDNVKLNLVIKGQGTVWIDDIRLLKGPLR